ncbi:hypothetical protein CYLTODRAFT_395607 [Cylindrobasidium torrendii FP15055 ss-10]|uniref:Uncharacterized protein n=1 Tax=Cylindrobasidium torrendii FP15055 ss-10 TaxID=1314674 RepID=A0A0D7BDU1_9AGAR|nr:hypothetical protein CYLTODRAFT_395607 [Cylindrobasidium torrendii FP15055 ss-10]
MMFSFVVVVVAQFVLAAFALPVEERGRTALVEERVVYSPPITFPTAGTVWVAGQEATVTWDTSGIPSDLTNSLGMVVLGYVTDDSPSEHLMIDTPLAKGFELSDGQVNITIPMVDSRNDYIIVLFGDSGNASPKFAIRGAAEAGGGAESSTETSSSPIPITGSSITGGTSAPATSSPQASSTSSPTTSQSSSSVIHTSSDSSTTTAANDGSSATATAIPDGASLLHPSIMFTSCFAMLGMLMLS